MVASLLVDSAWFFMFVIKSSLSSTDRQIPYYSYETQSNLMVASLLVDSAELFMFIVKSSFSHTDRQIPYSSYKTQSNLMLSSLLVDSSGFFVKSNFVRDRQITHWCVTEVLKKHATI